MRSSFFSISDSSTSNLRWMLSALLAFLIGLIALQCAPVVQPPQPFYEKGNYEAAVEQGQIWLTSHPEDSVARVVVAKSAYQLGDTVLTWEVLEPILDRTPAKEIRDMAVAVAMQTGHLATAKSILLQEIRNPTGVPNVDGRLARIESRIQEAMFAELSADEAFAKYQWTAAIRDYRKATLAYEGNDILQAKMRLARAEMLVDSQGQEGALLAYEMVALAHELWPESALAWWVHGDLAWKLGDEQLSRSSFEKALELNIGAPYRDKARMIVNSPDSF